MRPSFLELGLADLVAIYNELCDLGKPPPIIDVAELREDPEVCIAFQRTLIICAVISLCYLSFSCIKRGTERYFCIEFACSV